MRFGRSQTRAQAIALLNRAREIEPWDDDLLLDLAELYASNDQSDLALELLSTLACRVDGAMLRRVRKLQLRLTLSIRYVLLWLRACNRANSAKALPQEALPQLESPEREDADASVEKIRLRQVSARSA